MARKKSTVADFATENPENSETSEVLETLEPSQTPPTPEPPQVLEGGEKPAGAKDPVVTELKTAQKEEPVAAAQSKEEIEAAIQEKLSRKTDSGLSDPFVPNVQLENEVKEIASKKGFPLSRGTEIGARLMARSKRTGK